MLIQEKMKMASVPNKICERQPLKSLKGYGLPLPPALQTLRYYPNDYCRELSSAHR